MVTMAERWLGRGYGRKRLDMGVGDVVPTPAWTTRLLEAPVPP